MKKHINLMVKIMYEIDGHRLHLFPEKVQDWLETLPVTPITIELSPTSACNQRCYFCAFDYRKRGLCLDTQRTKRIIQQLHGLGVESLVFAGEGEPLLHPDLVMLVEAAVRDGLDCAVSTNGTLLHNCYQELLPLLKWMRISINETDCKGYEKIHRKASLTRVRKNIEHCVAYKAAAGLDMTIGAQVLLLPENEKRIDVIERELWEMGVDYVSIKPFSQHPQSSQHVINVKLPEGTPNARRKAFETVVTPKPYTHCWAAPFFMLITSDGNCWPCAGLVGKEELCFGNIRETKIGSLLFGDQRHMVLQKLATLIDVKRCRRPCRLDPANEYLDLFKNPHPHQRFL